MEMGTHELWYMFKLPMPPLIHNYAHSATAAARNFGDSLVAVLFKASAP